MKNISFKEDNIYYLETDIDAETILLINSDYSEFKDLQLTWDSKMGEIKSKLQKDLNKNINYGQASLDFFIDESESQYFETQFYSLLDNYDATALFDNIILISGLELNNLQESTVV